MTLSSISVLSLLTDTNVSLIGKKTELQSRLGLTDGKGLVAIKNSISDFVKVLFLIFRICDFSNDDLLICRDFSIEEVQQYSNPCNSRNAYRNCRRWLRQAKPDEGFKKTGWNRERLILELDTLCDTLFVAERTSELVSERENFFASASTWCPNTVIARTQAAGHTLIAKTELARDESVISLSPDIPIHIFSMFRDSRFPARDLVEQVGVHPDICFMTYLAFLRGSAAEGKERVISDFFKTQPESFETMYELPLEVVEALDEPELVESVVSQNQQLRDIAKSLSEVLSSAPTYEDLLWAKCLCASRAFSLPIQPQTEFESEIVSKFFPSGKLTTLIPIVHFVNHDFCANLDTPKIDSDGRIVVKALTNIPAGTQLTILYGGMNNKELMLNYGFYVPNNPYDQYWSGPRLIRRGAGEQKREQRTLYRVRETAWWKGQYGDLVEGYRNDRWHPS